MNRIITPTAPAASLRDTVEVDAIFDRIMRVENSSHIDKEAGRTLVPGRR